MNNRTLVIIPALNEAPTIIKTVQDVRDNGGPCDLIVVDSHSTDGMTELLNESGVTVIQTPRGGKGLAVRTAFRWLAPADHHDFWVMMDGDYTYPAKHIPEVVQAMAAGKVDTVVGWRRELAPRSMRLTNLVGNRALSWLAEKLYGYPVKDICSGMWGFTKEAVRRMQLTSHGFTLEADIFSNVVRAHCRVGQVPISYRARPDGSRSKLRIRDGLLIAQMLLENNWVRYREQPEPESAPDEIPQPR